MCWTVTAICWRTYHATVLIKELAFLGRSNTELTLQVRLVRSQPSSAEFLQTFKKAHHVYQRYQITVHGDTADKCNESQYKRFLCNSPLEVVLTCDLAWGCDGNDCRPGRCLEYRLFMQYHLACFLGSFILGLIRSNFYYHVELTVTFGSYWEVMLHLMVYSAKYLLLLVYSPCHTYKNWLHVFLYQTGAS